MDDRPVPSPPQTRRLAYAGLAIFALAWLIAARVLGPSDAWNYTQPKTIAYTTDIVANGHWLLPVDLGGRKATKPPLFNWMAAPFVGLFGFSCEAAHKAPSVLALVTCWLLLAMLIPRLLGAAPDWTVGWLAAAMFATGQTVSRIGYLARPDMLLTLWLLLGWLAATAILLAEAGLIQLAVGPRFRLALGFWLCVGLAALTKGPAALTLPIYAMVAARLIAGRFGAAAALRWSWGLPLACAMIGAWLMSAWRADAHHVWHQLFREEVFGRVSGLGSLSDPSGPKALLVKAPNMTAYFLARFAPWSIFTVLAAGLLLRRDPVTGRRRWRGQGREGAALLGAAIFIAVTIAFYTLSAGKRADYIASAYPPAALLASWWMLRGPRSLAVRAPWLAPAMATLVLAGETVSWQLQLDSPYRGFGDDMARVTRDLDARLRESPAPTVLWVAGNSHVPSFLGATDKGGPEALWRASGTPHPFWLITGRRQYKQVKQQVAGGDLGARPVQVHKAPRVRRSVLWKHDLLLVRFEPVAAIQTAGAAARSTAGASLDPGKVEAGHRGERLINPG